MERGIARFDRICQCQHHASVDNLHPGLFGAVCDLRDCNAGVCLRRRASIRDEGHQRLDGARLRNRISIPLVLLGQAANLPGSFFLGLHAASSHRLDELSDEFLETACDLDVSVGDPR